MKNSKAFNTLENGLTSLAGSVTKGLGELAYNYLNKVGGGKTLLEDIKEIGKNSKAYSSLQPKHLSTMRTLIGYSVLQTPKNRALILDSLKTDGLTKTNTLMWGKRFVNEKTVKLIKNSGINKNASLQRVPQEVKKAYPALSAFLSGEIKPDLSLENTDGLTKAEVKLLQSKLDAEIEKKNAEHEALQTKRKEVKALKDTIKKTKEAKKIAVLKEKLAQIEPKVKKEVKPKASDLWASLERNKASLEKTLNEEQKYLLDAIWNDVLTLTDL